MLPAPALLENEGQGEDLALPTRSTDRQMKTCKEIKVIQRTRKKAQRKSFTSFSERNDIVSP